MKKQNEGGGLLRTATRWQTVSHPTLGVRVSERRNALAYKRRLRREEKRTAMTTSAGAVPEAQHPHFSAPANRGELAKNLDAPQKPAYNHLIGW
jgi:hypothetical protein